MDGINGLLDFIKTPEGQGLLAGAFGYAANAQRGTPINNLGRGGIAGLLGYSNAMERQTQQEENKYQRQFRDMQMEQMRGQMERQRSQDDWRKNLPSVLGQAQATYSAGDEGPVKTPGNPQALQDYLLRPESPFADELLKRRILPQSPEYKVVGNSLVKIGDGGVSSVFDAPQKPTEAPAAVREYEYAQTQGFKGSFQDWETAKRRASAPSVAVNMSDPTAVAKAALQFQNDYRAATKPSFARSTAYNAMLEASQNPSAKGDLTMVYSFIKALDPESVVREGEIDLVNANRSIPDSIKGYAQRLASGQSLLPQERQDLLNQARTLSFTDYTRSRRDIQAYRENAQRLGLDPELYAPDPYAGVDFGPRKAPGKAAAPMADMPPAQQHKGRTIRDTQTGKLLQSDGMIWKEVK